MLIASSINELQSAKGAIETLKSTEPALFQKFMNSIRLTHQLQFGFQYMGCLITEEDPSKFCPTSQDEYVLSVYQREIKELKADSKFHDLKQLLANYKQISYANICKLAMGIDPKSLVGPTFIR